MIPGYVKQGLAILICPIFLLLLVLFPLNSYAIEESYIIQAGSFIRVEDARKQFDSIIRRFNENEIDFLRIEKVNKYYAVRLGKFENKAAAKKFLQLVSPRLSGAIILKAFYYNDRIVRQDRREQSSSENSEREETQVITAAKDNVTPGKTKQGKPVSEGNDSAYYTHLVKEGRYEEAIAAYEKAINESEDIKERAFLHKELGDLFVTKDDLKSASEEFIKALSLYKGFMEKERLRMAVYISWADRFDEAIAEFKLILSENPENIDAGINLAKTLSWSGRLDEAIHEADKVLLKSPDHRDALMVKANSLSWKGDVKQALYIYKALLQEEEDFDARLGLTNTLLSSGDIRSVQKNYRLLNPEYAYQKRELKKLNKAIGRATRSYLDMKYSYYNDNDDNQYNKYWLDYSFSVSNWRVNSNYRYTDAWDNTRDNDAHELFFSAYSKRTEVLGLGGGAGVSHLGNGETANFLTWHIKADVKILNGTIGASIVKDIFTETAQLIENRVRTINTGIYISQDLTDRLSLYGSYHYKDYSDENSANDLEFVSKYTVYPGNPKITAGYKFRYLDFNRQSGGGYFDPHDFISHQAFSSLYFKKGKYYSYLEPYVGHQSFKRFGVSSHDWIGGAYGIFGFKLTKDMLFEINSEGGNFAMETASGFKYYLIGIRLRIPIQ